VLESAVAARPPPVQTPAMLVEALAAALLSAGAAPPKPVLHACRPQGVAARCGTILVPEDRARPGGRRIGLRTVVIPARVRPARSDAFTYLSGGPGGAAATQMPAAARSIWAGVHERHDILLVDQRGTGGSNALVCPAATGPLDTDDQRSAYVRSCLDALPGEYLRYGTVAAMDDLDAVRAALGYRRLDVYGTSYGATAAQVYLNLHPRSVRTLILDGGTFLDVPFYSRFAANADRALQLLERRCAAERACARAFPGWRAQLDSLIAAWNAHPQQLSPSAGITGDGLAGVVHRLTLVAEQARFVPYVVSRAAAGDYAPLLLRLGSAELNRSAMYWSISCNEPWVGLDSRGPWGGYVDGLTVLALEQYRTVCRFLPSRDEPASAWARPRSPVPALVLAGEADPQDPIGNLPELRSALPNSRVVIAPGQGHGVGAYGCLGDLVSRFVERGTTRGLDMSCARRIRPPAFAVG
jgi:pimeloyl-ACP methyl ester carboxylesterase